MSETINVPMAAQRDIKTVTTEIRTLHRQAQCMVLGYAIEIGRRLKEAKAMLDSCDAIALLRDWAHSKGACIEMTYAQYVGKKLMRLWDMPDGLWLREGI